jgi:hypothetical protein
MKINSFILNHPTHLFIYDVALVVKCDCTAEDEVDENPSGFGEEQKALNATAGLDEYLALPQVLQNNPDGNAFDVLEWLRVHSCRYPNVAGMARGVFAQPASFAGVERFFSVACQKHGDAQKIDI